MVGHASVRRISPEQAAKDTAERLSKTFEGFAAVKNELGAIVGAARDLKVPGVYSTKEIFSFSSAAVITIIDAGMGNKFNTVIQPVTAMDEAAKQNFERVKAHFIPAPPA